jgi:catechol 2,3-dioxygenase-like lactoylglutathione lyase family enzyme
MRLERIVGFRLVSREPDKLVRFYSGLGFGIDDARPIDPAEMALLGLTGRATRRPIRIGQTNIDLDAFDPAGAAYPASATAISRCFQHLALVTDEVGEAWAKARAAGARPIGRDGAVTLPAASGGVTAIKFRDPEGHPLELIRFPDAGDKWPGKGLLGIDHSAIVTAGLAASHAFYAGLGLICGAATLNGGPAQDALDGVEAACADVVPMLPGTDTPHVELLHYRTPKSGPWPPWKANDAVATRMIWRGDAPAVLRDPDGHLHQIET